MARFFRPPSRADRDLKSAFGKQVATCDAALEPNELTAAYMTLREMQSRLDSGFSVTMADADGPVKTVKDNIGQANDAQLEAWLDHDHCGGILMLAVTPTIREEAIRRGLFKTDPMAAAYFPKARV